MPSQRAPARQLEPGPAEVERPRLRVVGLPPREEPHPDVAASLLALAGGRRTVEREFQAQHDLDGQWLAVLSPAEQRTLRHLLERLATQHPGDNTLVG